MITALGVDPGLRNTGLAAVHYDSATRSWTSRGARYLMTEKDQSKKQHVRVATDDARRLMEVFRFVHEGIAKTSAQVVGVEIYTIFENNDTAKIRDKTSELLALFGGVSWPHGDAFRADVAKWTDAFYSRFRASAHDVKKLLSDVKERRGMGNAAKTYGAYMLVHAAAAVHGIPVYAYMPRELRVHANNGRGGTTSKETVMHWVDTNVTDASKDISEAVRRSLSDHVYDAMGLASMAARDHAIHVASLGGAHAVSP